MSEFKIYGPCNPSVLRQLARIRRERDRQELARAIMHGILLAVFAIALGVITCTFCLAFSGPY